MNTETINNRYQRQIQLKEFGLVAQQKLLNARVLVVGAGGLACPALLYLAAAGLGTINIIDHDLVELSNLHRQVLFTMEDLGKPKAEIAAKRLKALNPELNIQHWNDKLGTNNALDLIRSVDLVIDGSDNFPTRYLVNDACLLLDKPMVYGAVLGFEGQVGVFNFLDKVSGIKTNYRDLFPLPPDASSVLSCNEMGVLGVLPGIIGTMQATEAIKIIADIGQTLCNKIISYNALTNSFYDVELVPRLDSNGLLAQSKEEFEKFNYELYCNADLHLPAISISEFNTLRMQEPLTIIDVRENNEWPIVDEFKHLKIPLAELEQRVSAISKQHKIVVFCNSGKRSLIAIKKLSQKFPECAIYNLNGGIEAWKKESIQV